MFHRYFRAFKWFYVSTLTLSFACIPRDCCYPCSIAVDCLFTSKYEFVLNCFGLTTGELYVERERSLRGKLVVSLPSDSKSKQT